MKAFKFVGASLVGCAAVVLAACGGSSTTTTVVQESSGGTTTKSSDSSTTKGGIALSAPSGSDQLNSSDRSGVEYVRYSNSDKTPAEVVAAYKQEASSAGWSITKDSGGGGGWGPYGGSNYGLRAKKDGEYFAVQAGGQKGHTTYFEACSGSGSGSICEDLSSDAHTGSGGSGYNENRNHSRSRWS
ncbi:MAG: hypothetical protein F2813_01450 [Actinobacteria bacterium]|uniref:Unannotated protein n=1 Tax=freshwater metagenome TaxID=449393 RepID=A0A6J5Z7K8_9ZZZZ|nr:hypothetical protein [Actinomycetota bacterium]